MIVAAVSCCSCAARMPEQHVVVHVVVFLLQVVSAGRALQLQLTQTTRTSTSGMMLLGQLLRQGTRAHLQSWVSSSRSPQQLHPLLLVLVVRQQLTQWAVQQAVQQLHMLKAAVTAWTKTRMPKVQESLSTSRWASSTAGRTAGSTARSTASFTTSIPTHSWQALSVRARTGRQVS